MNKKIILSLLFLIFLIPVSAHLDGGKDKIVDGYLIDFGYSPENIFEEQKIILAFNLLNKSTQEIIEPESVWVRISSSEEVIFAGTFRPELKHVSFTFTFPEEGKYEIFAKFQNNEKTIVEGKFDLEVHEESFLSSIINFFKNLF